MPILEGQNLIKLSVTEINKAVEFYLNEKVFKDEVKVISVKTESKQYSTDVGAEVVISNNEIPSELLEPLNHMQQNK